MSVGPNHYKVLGVPEGADATVIRAAYRSLMRDCHPDLNTNDAAAARARLANEAYRILRDPERKAEYDRHRMVRVGSHSRSLHEFNYPTSPRHDIMLFRSPAALTRGPWLPFFVFVGVVISSFSGLLASGFLDNPPTTLTSVSSQNEKPIENRHLDELTAAIVQDRPTAPSLAEGTGERALTGSSQNEPRGEFVLPPVISADVADGAGKFAQVSLQVGMAGAQQYSVYCHKQVAATQSWRRADRCTAFDITAAYVDSDVAQSTRGPANRYFVSQIKERNNDYRLLGAPQIISESRIADIQRTILPIVFPNDSKSFRNEKGDQPISNRQN